MQMFQLKNELNNVKSRGLFVPDDEWNRLKKVLSQKDDEKAVLEKYKQNKIDQRNISKKLTETWENTLKKISEEETIRKRKYAADLESIRQKRDVVANQEILDRRNKILDKARSMKWSAMDSTKMMTRAVHKMQISRERELQKEFDDAQKANALEKERLLKIEENLEAKQYQKSLWDRKLKQAKVKRENAAVLLKEIKTREGIRRDEKRKLIEEENVELKKIVQEIEDEKKKEKAKLRTRQEIIVKDLSENRKIVAANKELQKFQEQQENLEIEILDEAKKIMSKTKKLKEKEFIDEKLKLSEKPTINREAEKERKFNIALQNFNDEKERQYQKEVLQKNESLKEKIKDIANSKKEFEEEYKKEKEQSTLSRQWEQQRWKREHKMLCDMKELLKRANIDKKENFRKQLDVQCVNNRATRIANQKAEQEHYEALIKMWHQEDEKFMTYIEDLMNGYVKMGKSILPLLRSIEEYMEKNKLRLNATNHSRAIPYTSLRKSCL